MQIYPTFSREVLLSGPKSDRRAEPHNHKMGESGLHRNRIKGPYVPLLFFFSDYGRCGGLMVSALDSGSGGPGSSPGRGTALRSWARYLTLIPANLLLGVTLRWTSIPSRDE